MGQTVNLLTYVFGGSNPSIPTFFSVILSASIIRHSPATNTPCRIYFFRYATILQAGVAQLVERQPSKLKVAGSSLVSRSIFFIDSVADVAQGQSVSLVRKRSRVQFSSSAPFLFRSIAFAGYSFFCLFRGEYFKPPTNYIPISRSISPKGFFLNNHTKTIKKTTISHGKRTISAQ